MDTAFAFIRRVAKGQSPFHPDRGHFHHRLVDMGLNQKQAVAILYAISAMLGLVAVVVVSTGTLRICLLGFTAVVAVVISRFIHHTLVVGEQNHSHKEDHDHETV